MLCSCIFFLLCSWFERLGHGSLKTVGNNTFCLACDAISYLVNHHELHSLTWNTWVRLAGVMDFDAGLRPDKFRSKTVPRNLFNRSARSEQFEEVLVSKGTTLRGLLRLGARRVGCHDERAGIGSLYGLFCRETLPIGHEVGIKR
jgi:hypothetical protein